MRFAFPCGLAIMIGLIGRTLVTLLVSDGSGSTDAQSSVLDGNQIKAKTAWALLMIKSLTYG